MNMPSIYCSTKSLLDLPTSLNNRQIISLKAICFESEGKKETLTKNNIKSTLQ